MTYNDRLRLYTNQTASLEKKAGVNAFGVYDYEAPVDIPARVEADTKIVRDAQGKDVVSNTTVFSPIEISVGDKIGGREVIDVSTMVDRAGRIVGWEAYL